MCLAVPMKITGIDGFNATCEAKGIQREVSLFMLQGEPIDVGDHVLIHVVEFQEARASPLSARKFLRIRKPVSPLFSGWNCVPETLPARSAAEMRRPW